MMVMGSLHFFFFFLPNVVVQTSNLDETCFKNKEDEKKLKYYYYCIYRKKWVGRARTTNNQLGLALVTQMVLIRTVLRHNLPINI